MTDIIISDIFSPPDASYDGAQSLTKKRIRNFNVIEALK